jgi:hypothetical protein
MDVMMSIGFGFAVVMLLVWFIALTGLLDP